MGAALHHELPGQLVEARLAAGRLLGEQARGGLPDIDAIKDTVLHVERRLDAQRVGELRRVGRFGRQHGFSIEPAAHAVAGRKQRDEILQLDLMNVKSPRKLQSLLPA